MAVSRLRRDPDPGEATGLLGVKRPSLSPNPPAKAAAEQLEAAAGATGELEALARVYIVAGRPHREQWDSK